VTGDSETAPNPAADDQGEIVLSASSPDEEALVLGAKYFGFEFVNRQEGVTRLLVRDMAGPLEAVGAAVEEKYEVLRELPFNSDRKRMSVIVRCVAGNK
jgi:phospholipid-transporting ATPase